MKDINGKTLRKGDVVMCLYPDERYFGKFCVVEHDPNSYSDKKHFCITSQKTGERVFRDLPSKLYVEIIGDVR